MEGLIEDFWHDGGYTVVMLVNSRGQRIELTLEYMDEVEVTVE